MENIIVLLLRGAHTSDAVIELAHKLEKADIILFENPDTKAVKMAWRNVFYNLGSNQEYIERVSKDIDRLTQKWWIAEIAWLLHGQSKIIDFVDYTLTDYQLNEREKLQPEYGFADILGTLERYPQKRYILLDEFFTEKAKIVHSRDEVVLNQVLHLIHGYDQDPIKSILLKKGSCTIAIVQGYMHKIRGALEKKCPEILVTEDLYNKNLVKILLATPYITLLDQKTNNPTLALKHKNIDFFLYYQFQKALSNNPATSSSSHDGTSNEIMELGISHPSIISDKKLQDSGLTIDAFSEAELKSLVDKFLIKGI